MGEKIRITEVEGRTVIDPATGQRIAREGIVVDRDDVHWHRQIMFGDVVEAQDAAAAAANDEAPATTRKR